MAISTIIREVRYAARQLRTSPGFTLTALLTLALGIGVTAAVYSVIETVLLEPLPYSNADRLVGVAFTFPHEKPNAEQAGSSADFVRDHAQVFETTATIDDGTQAVNLSLNGGSLRQVTALRVSEGYVRTLGASAALGRVFTVDEDRAHGPRVAVLSDALWARVFHRDRGVLGRIIHINEDSFAVVGVMPASFTVSAESAPGVLASPELWEPLQLSANDPVYDGDNFQMIARLRRGVTLLQAQQQLHALEQPFYQQHPDYRKWTDDDQSIHDFRLWKLQDVIVGDVQRSLWTVMGAVIAVLLVACLNLAGLVIARSMRRGREMAVRAALGATTAQLLRLLLCEGMLLAIGGGALAFVVAEGATGLLMHAAPLAIPALRGAPGAGLMAAVVLCHCARIHEHLLPVACGDDSGPAERLDAAGQCDGGRICFPCAAVTDAGGGTGGTGHVAGLYGFRAGGDVRQAASAAVRHRAQATDRLSGHAEGRPLCENPNDGAICGDGVGRVAPRAWRE